MGTYFSLHSSVGNYEVKLEQTLQSASRIGYLKDPHNIVIDISEISKGVKITGFGVDYFYAARVTR